MSPIRLPKLHDFTSPFSKKRSRRLRPASRTQQPLKFRNLLIDPLEERQLLTTVGSSVFDDTVTAYTYTDLLVNQTYDSYQQTIAGQSIAVDNDGDFVVTWARQDVYTYGNGKTTSDWNIYARYFTDEMQRLTIPTSTVTTGGTLSLLLGGEALDTDGNNAIQKLTFSAATIENTSSQDNIVAGFTFRYVTDTFTTNTITFEFDERYDAATNAQALENKLRGIGDCSKFTSAQVVATSSKEFLVYYKVNTDPSSSNYDYYVQNQLSQPLLTWTETHAIKDVDYDGDIEIGGFLPSVAVKSVSEPYLVKDIPVVKGDATKTAANIQYVINSLGKHTVTVVANTTLTNTSDMTKGNFVLDITFVGTSGKQNQAEIQVTSLISKADGNDYADATNVETIKETSDEFKVNVEDAEDEDTVWPECTDQTAPAVAIDSDGDFVITWESAAPVTNSATVSDVYARRYSPGGSTTYTDSTSATWKTTAITGITALGGQFRVNTTTANAQGTPAVAMDDAGNFIIVWASCGQQLSYFNGIYSQRYDLNGNRVANEILVQAPDTLKHYDPYVSMSGDGYAAVTWTVETDIGHGSSFLVIQNPTGTSVYEARLGAIADETTSSFDDSNNLLVSWTEIAEGSVDVDQGGNESLGVRATEYSLFDAEGNVSVQTIRSTFRVNSASTDPGSQTTWAWSQRGSQAMIDADGDITITYSGYGADYPDKYSTDEDADQLIEAAMVQYIQSLWTIYGVTPGTSVDDYPDEMNYALAQRRQQLEAQYNYLRGSANDILSTSSDASAGQSPSFLTSDLVVQNTDSDAQNMRLYLVFPSVTSGGSVTLRCWNPMSAGGYQDISISFDTEDDLPKIDDILKGIDDAFEGLSFLGATYPEADGYPGPVTVRQVYSSEITERSTTPWAISGAASNDYVFEVTFIGSAHDFNFSVALFKNDLEGAEVDEVKYLTGPTTGTGYFALTLAGPPTDFIYYDGSDPEATAANIQTALEAVNGGAYAGVEVEYELSTTEPGKYNFIITFSGDAGGKNQPAMTLSYPSGTGSLPRMDGLSTYTFVEGHTEQYPNFQVVHYTYGDMGTTQAEACAGMEPDGDYTVAWTQYETRTTGSYTNSNIYYKLYNETTDTAGPMVTDFLLPDGTRLATGGQVNEALKQIVVGFDEEMLTSGTYSVTNTSNWCLLKDGVEVIGGIKSIVFGMSKAYDLGLSSVASNKWEAVITMDGNGLSSGDAVLSDGHYTIVAKNTLRDAAGNPLRYTGVNVNGTLYEREFDVLTPASGEVLVNADTTDGTQTTNDTSSQSVATDADGDYVVVWTDESGVWAKYYNVTWTTTSTSREIDSDATVVTTIHVSSEISGDTMYEDLLNNPTACNATVAMDADGDFVVTWSQMDDSTGDWDVLARRYNAAGVLQTNGLQANGTSNGDILVVSEDLNDEIYLQRYSSVAMDSDGDFVVTWQSLDQDGSGYGIYAKRYDATGNAVGGINEIQVISFLNSFTGTFTLAYGDQTQEFSYLGSTHTEDGSGDTIVTLIQAWLDGLNVNATVTATSFSALNITFNTEGDQDQISVQDPIPDSGSTGTVQSYTRVDGKSAEFLVNDTTEGNQRFASIAMSADGSFVISWTSSGQGDDAAYETNIYAKRFFSNDVITGGAVDTASTGATSSTGSTTTTADLSAADVGSLITTTDDPNNHTVSPGTGYDGVVEIQVNYGDGSYAIGSGSLLTTGMHILTAAHVVCYEGSNVQAPTYQITVTFHLSTGDLVYDVSEVFVNATYSGIPWSGGGDLAVLVLEAPAPTSVERYDIYRGNDEIGQVFEKVGYGVTGTGETGETYDAGTKHHGQNRYEAINSLIGDYGDSLVYDFDSGLAENDALGVYCNIHDLGLGEAESMGARGDSGGPTFIDGKIAGVTSYGWGNTITDAHFAAIPDSSFGEIGVDVRVSLYADWIDATLATGASEFLVNQTTTGDQIWSAVGMDYQGNFVISWSSYNQDGVGDGPGASANGQYGIYARRYDDQGVATSDEFLVNSYAAGNQQHSSVAMDADGDFVITWESYQDRPSNASSTTQADEANSYGIYAQRYVRTSLVGKSTTYGTNGELGSEMQINTTQDGDQRYPSVAMDATGDFVVVWSGNGQVTDQMDDAGVFYTYFTKAKDDTGPIVTSVTNVLDGDLSSQQSVPEAAALDSVSYFIVYFSEALIASSKSGVNSVLNTSNWELKCDGQVVYGGVASVQDVTSDLGNGEKYAFLVTFGGDAMNEEGTSLQDGTYVLTIKDRIQDVSKNALDGNMDGTAGGNFSRSFTIGEASSNTPNGPDVPDADDEDEPVNTTTLGYQDSVAVASSADGAYVLVWVDYTWGDGGNIIGQLYDKYGEKNGNEFYIASYATGAQITPDVAMDDYGNFVVVWAGVGAGKDKIVEESGIFARIFDSAGVAQGDQIRVNSYRLGNQITPAVALDNSGHFIVTWSGQGSTAEYSGVYGHLFDITGASKSNDFQINTYTNGGQTTPDVATDSDGNFVVVWTSNGKIQDGSSSGIYARRYSSTGKALTGEFRVNTYTTSAQFDPAVAMDADGDFVVTWTSMGQDKNSYGIYAKRFSKAGVAQGSEFLVNQTTVYAQVQPAVAMDDSGKFVISWTTFGQDNYDKLGPGDTTPKDNGIYARIFNADGTSYRYDLDDDGTAEALGELRINATTEGDQVTSAVSMDSDGDLVIAWVGPDGYRGTDIFQRAIALNSSSSSSSTSGDTVTTSLKDPRIATLVNTSAKTLSSLANLALTGTTGKDTFEFIAGTSASSWIVKVNGVIKAVARNTTAITFNGLGGADTVLLTGTTGVEKAVVKAGTVTFTGSGFTITASNMEVFTLKGGNGKDTLQLTDTASNDTLTVTTDLVSFTGGYTLNASGFETVEATATAGTDTANVYDSTSDDVLTMTSTVSTMVGGDYTFRVSGFDKVNGFATSGSDKAVLTGTSGKDTLVINPTAATLTGTSYALKATGFDTLQANGVSGTGDTATLSGAADSKDTLVASPKTAALSNSTAGYDWQVSNFAAITVDGGTAGEDVATLNDSTGNDTLVASPTKFALTGSGYSLTATQFEDASAVSSGKGTDTATLNDSTGDDFFEALASGARLYGTGYSLRAKGFDSVTGVASKGYDTATIQGSIGNDTFTLTKNLTTMTGSSLTKVAKLFDAVYLEGNGGTDTATITDALTPTTGTTMSSLSTSGVTEAVQFSGIKKVQFRKSTVKTYKNDVSNVDLVLAYWK